ncbi:hypothetical protein STCU_10246 [Strigomonas culicis]|uniref:Uncharacterized protein n=1 Tax=Strigomonas culicis TaxID=28005 RepID=S9UU02_9TRYP|nr:hypothetical protein STCU_10246 [Strigomonas culicis]|eukprot:EPY18021.1 hypothetical protein STCU_10246 [Strigomonas culicis]
MERLVELAAVHPVRTGEGGQRTAVAPTLTNNYLCETDAQYDEEGRSATTQPSQLCRIPRLNVMLLQDAYANGNGDADACFYSLDLPVTREVDIAAADQPAAMLNAKPTQNNNNNVNKIPQVNYHKLYSKRSDSSPSPMHMSGRSHALVGFTASTEFIHFSKAKPLH